MNFLVCDFKRNAIAILTHTSAEYCLITSVEIKNKKATKRYH